jgi:hypothetical protein
LTETSVVQLSGDRGGTWRCDMRKQIGSIGGFASVYEGEAEDGSPVAVKLTHAGLRRELDSHLIDRESEIAGKLACFETTNIIRTLDWGAFGERVFLVMERAETSLADHLDRVGPLGDLEAADVLRQVSLGLKELHSIGVIHRDLSSSNILLHEGRWKLSDFGISRDTDIGTRQVTFKARDIGNPCYKAPELWEGGSPDERSDLYAFGCVAFEVLSGRLPFEGTWDEIRQKHLLETPPPVSSDCHIALQSMIPRLMAKDRDGRLSTAQSVYTQLSAIGAPDDALTAALLLQLKRHADERAALDVQTAAAREEARRIDVARKAAREELAQLCETATLRLQAAVPDLELSLKPYVLGTFDVRGGLFRCADAQLMLGAWPDSVDVSWDQDTLLLAGEVVAVGRRDPKHGHRLANVVYESRDGTSLAWHLYRFTDSPVRQGESQHGFASVDFKAKRHPMLSGIYDGWTLAIVPLTPEAIGSLFAEALALPAG